MYEHGPCTSSRGERRPVSVGFVLQCVNLGRTDGSIQLVRADDTASAEGLSAARLRGSRNACRLVVDGSKKERLTPGAYHAPKGPDRQPPPRHPESCRPRTQALSAFTPAADTGRRSRCAAAGARSRYSEVPSP